MEQPPVGDQVDRPTEELAVVPAQDVRQCRASKSSRLYFSRNLAARRSIFHLTQLAHKPHLEHLRPPFSSDIEGVSFRTVSDSIKDIHASSFRARQ